MHQVEQEPAQTIRAGDLEVGIIDDGRHAIAMEFAKPVAGYIREFLGVPAA